MTTHGLDRSAAPKTPAQQLITLRTEIAALMRERDEANIRADRAEVALKRYTELGDVSFGGIRLAQTWTEFLVWEALLNHTNPRAVYEFGTWEGGFAWWLWAQAQVRGFQFHTFDSIVPKAKMPPDSFTKADVFQQFELLGSLLLAWEPLILFCDNGNKPREIQMYGPVLQHEDSFVVVHDWGTEIQPEDVPESLEMVHEQFCKDVGSMSRIFRRRR